MSRLSEYRAWKQRPSKLEAYRAFLRRKAVLAPSRGFAVRDEEMTPSQFGFQKVVTQWAAAGGNRAIFLKFGMGKTRIQLDLMRLCLLKTEATHALITAPLGMRTDSFRDAAAMGIGLRFIRSNEEIAGPGVYLTNFESVREGKVNPALFGACSLDEASVLRGFGGTKTFREFMRVYDTVPHKFVATAIPDPNEHIELLAYAAFLGIMDVGQAKTRFFKRDSTKADTLTLHVHKEREFWMWVASWACFLQHPDQLCECACHSESNSKDSSSESSPHAPLHWPKRRGGSSPHECCSRRAALNRWPVRSKAGRLCSATPARTHIKRCSNPEKRGRKNHGLRHPPRH